MEIMPGKYYQIIDQLELAVNSISSYDVCQCNLTNLLLYYSDVYRNTAPFSRGSNCK